MKKLVLVLALFVGSLLLNSCTDPTDDLVQDKTEQGYAHDEIGNDTDTSDEETGD